MLGLAIFLMLFDNGKVDSIQEVKPAILFIKEHGIHTKYFLSFHVKVFYYFFIYGVKFLLLSMCLLVVKENLMTHIIKRKTNNTYFSKRSPSLLER